MKVLLLLAGLQQLYALQLAKFYPFGTNVGDAILPRNDNDGSDPISLSTPFNFFNRSPTSIYVSLVA